MSHATTISIIRRADLPFRPVQGDGAAGLSLARLHRPTDNSFTFQMARIEPGGVSRRHAHAWEQVNVVVSGSGLVDTGETQTLIGPGDCVVFPGHMSHAISATGDEPLVLVAVLGPGAA
ncbi:MAG: cupin domain-containing protein [Acidobacteriota bacterium]